MSGDEQGSPAQLSIPEISVSELKERLDRGQPIVLVDVREPFEKEIADLPEKGQVRIPLGEFESRLEELDPDDPIVLYCRTGNRSGWATQRLRARGFQNAWNLQGGLMAWRDEIDPSLPAY